MRYERRAPNYCHDDVNQDRARSPAQLIAAERVVAEGQTYLIRQEAFIGQLERDGHDTTEARSLLVAMLNAQALDVLDRDRMVAELKDF